MSKELVVPNTVPAIIDADIGIKINRSAVRPIVVLARPAIESVLIPPDSMTPDEWVKSFQDPDTFKVTQPEIYIAPAPYSHVMKAAISNIAAGGGFAVRIEKAEAAKHTGSPSLFGVYIGDKTTLWGSTEQETQAKVDERTEILKEQDTLAKDHEFGDASFVVINEFGGFDYTKPEETATHIAFRGLLANHAGQDHSSLRGLLHPELNGLISKQFRAHMDQLATIFKGVCMMSEEARHKRHMQDGFEEAVERSQKFLETLRPTLEIAVAQINHSEIFKAVQEELGPPKRDGQGRLLVRRVET